MQIQCKYCGSYIPDSEEKCPNCGGVNDGVKRTADGTPRTIEELKAFAESKNIPLDKFRFFIGEDCREAKAFGIYKDEKTGHFVVYKNKSDGSRSVRYEGADEAYAVNELYQKLKEQVFDYKSYVAGKQGTPVHSPASSGSRKKSRPVLSGNLIAIIIIALIIFYIIGRLDEGKRYSEYHYSYLGVPYMYNDSTNLWYGYDDYGNTYETTPPEELINNPSDYYEYVDEYNTRTSDSSWDDDDDYDWDWGSDDWDSDWDSGWDSDWDSDW